MKWTRLWQPRNPIFWLVVVLNALSTGLAWLVRTYPLSPAMAVAVAVFAMGNAVLGLRLMWGLVKEPSLPGKSSHQPGA